MDITSEEYAIALKVMKTYPKRLFLKFQFYFGARKREVETGEPTPFNDEILLEIANGGTDNPAYVQKTLKKLATDGVGAIGGWRGEIAYFSDHLLETTRLFELADKKDPMMIYAFRRKDSPLVKIGQTRRSFEARRRELDTAPTKFIKQILWKPAQIGSTPLEMLSDNDVMIALESLGGKRTTGTKAREWFIATDEQVRAAYDEAATKKLLEKL